MIIIGFSIPIYTWLHLIHNSIIVTADEAPTSIWIVFSNQTKSDFLLTDLTDMTDLTWSWTKTWSWTRTWSVSGAGLT